MTYYRITDGSFHELTAEEYAARVANGKAANLRLYVEDPRPADTQTHKAVSSIVVSPTEARLTWEMVAKTPAEIEADEINTELAQIDTLIADVQTQNAIDNATFNAGTTAQKFDILRVDRRVLLRAARFLLRRARRGGL
jgi:hypothetical protein